MMKSKKNKLKTSKRLKTKNIYILSVSKLVKPMNQVSRASTSNM